MSRTDNKRNGAGGVWVMAAFLESSGTLLVVLTPLVAVPLTVITFYLRSLREHQVTWHGELVRRFETVEAATVDLRKLVSEFERDYTTKEEWLRECMHARRVLEKLRETTVRLDATMEGRWPVAAGTRSDVRRDTAQDMRAGSDGERT